MKSTGCNRKAGKYYFLLMILLMGTQFAHAQKPIAKEIEEKFGAYRTQVLQEKIYVHVDRSFYYTGETMWFKVLAVDGTLHKPLDVSEVAYLEIVDQANHPVLQTKIELKAGAGYGSLFLPPSLSSGNYLVRAYTRWMRNFDPEFYFQQHVSILNTLRKPETVATTELRTPDVQFFPEGGNLVKGLKSKVAFRAVDHKGLGIEFKGAVVNAANDTVVKFDPEKFGIGHFSFTPEAAQVYRAIVKDMQGKVTEHPLPAVNNLGYVINLTDSADWLRVTTTATLSEQEPDVVYLLVHARNQIATSVTGRLVRGKNVFSIEKKSLGDGINHLTLFNALGNPMCERLYFNRPEKNLVITAKSDKPEYDNRKKIILSIDAKSALGVPMPADLSVAVYRKDSLQTIQHTGIGEYLWLTSELRGAIESPGYYMQSTDEAASRAMDNLMLTHGWSRFRWDDILKGTAPQFPYSPEPRGFVLTGTVTNTITNVPAANIKTFLSVPGKNIQLYAARSNQQGQVMFQMKDFFGVNKIVMQTDLQMDSIYQFKIDDVFSHQFTNGALPTFTLAAKFKDRILTRSIHAQVERIFYADSSKFVKIPADTVVFYGKPNSRYYLDDYTRFAAMEDVLREYVGAVFVRKKNNIFHFWVLDELNGTVFRDNSMVLLDGVPVFREAEILAYDPLKVKKLEIITRKFFLGPAVFNGIVSFTTPAGNLADFPLDARSLVQNYEGLQQQREYYSPRYESVADRNSRLPDFRDLLFWTPEVKPDANGRYAIEFYSSDTNGKYEIVVQGLTKDGRPGSTTATFEVNGVSN